MNQLIIERQENSEVPKKTFFYRVEYDDRNRPTERIIEYVAIDSESEFDARSKAGVGTTVRAGQRLYNGNHAPFSNVSVTLLTDSNLLEEDPTQRTAEGQSTTIRALCLDNRLVWGEKPQ